ncbi:TCR/Tet family MFS transporter [Candidatus Gracilibacteria bacterium]|nr:TCR/Tet family MFS transporter [Candidatus Gracilibacteria bacterium]
MPWNLLIVYAMVVLDTAIQVIAYPIFPDLVKDIPHSTFWFSMALALFRFMQLVVSPLFGYIADKYSRKIVFIFAAMGTILSFLVMLPTKAWSLFANRSIDGSTNGFMWQLEAQLLIGVTGKIGILGWVFWELWVQ